MSREQEISQMLVQLGLGKPAADAYIQLVRMPAGEPATGYQVAKALGKDPTSVYKALEELRQNGAVETVAGRGKQFRPVAPEELIKKLQDGLLSVARKARSAMAELPRPAVDEEVFRLATVSQVRTRFAALLDNCQRVALLDLAPAILRDQRRRIRKAVERGVSVVIKLYAEPDEKAQKDLEGTFWIVEPQGDDLLDLMPGPVMHGVFDCRAQLVTYLPSRLRAGASHVHVDRDTEVPQAFWTPNLFLSYQAHSGLASEIIHTALRDGMQRGMDCADMQYVNDDLSMRIHGPLDWETLWEDAGFTNSKRRRSARDRMLWGGAEAPGMVAEPRLEIADGDKERDRGRGTKGGS